MQVPFHEVDAHNIVPVWVASGAHNLHFPYTCRPCVAAVAARRNQQHGQQQSPACIPHCADKREYAARTIRPKIHSKLPEFLQEFPELPEQASIAMTRARNVADFWCALSTFVWAPIEFLQEFPKLPQHLMLCCRHSWLFYCAWAGILVSLSAVSLHPDGTLHQRCCMH